MNEDQVVLWISIAINLVAFIVLFLKGRWTVIILAIAATLLSQVAIIRNVLASHHHGAVAMVAADCDLSASQAKFDVG